MTFPLNMQIDAYVEWLLERQPANPRIVAYVYDDEVDAKIAIKSAELLRTRLAGTGIPVRCVDADGAIVAVLDNPAVSRGMNRAL